MRQPYDNVLRVQIPASLSERLRATANQYARSPSDVVREAVVVQLYRLSGRTSNHDWQPPEAAQGSIRSTANFTDRGSLRFKKGNTGEITHETEHANEDRESE